MYKDAEPPYHTQHNEQVISPHHCQIKTNDTNGFLVFKKYFTNKLMFQNFVLVFIKHYLDKT